MCHANFSINTLRIKYPTRIKQKLKPDESKCHLAYSIMTVLKASSEKTFFTTPLKPSLIVNTLKMS